MCDARRGRNLRRFAWIPIVGLALTGCSGGDRIRRAIMRPDPQQAMATALNVDAPAGERRTSLRDVAESKSATATWAVDGYLRILETEHDPQLRSIAARALPQSGDGRALQALINAAKEPPDARQSASVTPKDDLCRWDAVLGIEKMSRAGAVSPDQQDAAVGVLAEVLERDPSRHVRAAAATALGTFQRPAAVDALIGGLRDSHFAVTHASDSGLVALTGQNFHCDPASWERWRNSNRDSLFANAGRVPEDRKAGYGSDWDEKRRSMKATFRSFLWRPKKSEPSADPAAPRTTASTTASTTAATSPAVAAESPASGSPAPSSPPPARASNELTPAPSSTAGSSMTPAGSAGASAAPTSTSGTMQPVPSAGRVP